MKKKDFEETWVGRNYWWVYKGLKKGERKHQRKLLQTSIKYGISYRMDKILFRFILISTGIYQIDKLHPLIICWYCFNGSQCIYVISAACIFTVLLKNSIWKNKWRKKTQAVKMIKYENDVLLSLHVLWYTCWLSIDQDRTTDYTNLKIRWTRISNNNCSFVTFSV